MSVLGFDFFRGSIAHSVSIIPPRPQALVATHRSPSYNMSYWYHPHTSRKDLPIVFLHGIGVGLYPYMQLLRELNMGRRDEDGKIGILAVEILPISSRITAPIPRKEDMCHQFQFVLRYHKIENFVLVSHSSVTHFITQERSLILFLGMVQWSAHTYLRHPTWPVEFLRLYWWTLFPSYSINQMWCTIL